MPDILEFKRWRLLMRSAGAAHVARVALSPGRVSRLHTHDFAEVFWVERGVVRHEVDGVVQSLPAGALCGILPSRRHRVDLDAGSTGQAGLFNLAFPASRLRALARVHPAAVARLFGSASRPCPVVSLPEEGLLELRAAGDALLAAVPDHLELDYRLLQIFRWTMRQPARPPAMPDWLARGLDSLARPESWERGLDGFHRACGRSPAQVARVMRASLGVAPIAHLNKIRMEHAERQLRLTPRPIVEIAGECGFSGLAHFYRLFTEKYGESPHRYRRRHQGAVR